MMATMDVYINNKLQSVENNCTINDLFRAINLESTKGIAVAVNSNVIPKAAWDQKRLAQDDQILLIKATHGG